MIFFNLINCSSDPADPIEIVSETKNVCETNFEFPVGAGNEGTGN